MTDAKKTGKANVAAAAPFDEKPWADKYSKLAKQVEGMYKEAGVVWDGLLTIADEDAEKAIQEVPRALFMQGLGFFQTFSLTFNEKGELNAKDGIDLLVPGDAAKHFSADEALSAAAGGMKLGE